MTERVSMIPSHPPDQAARDRAVDTGDSFIVQAPAGSGKTMLLTERFLRLLATVDEPEQVLAITFTKAAVAEMRSRAMRALSAARDGRIPEKADERRLYEAATLALQHGDALGWNLLEDPQQLNIATLDSLALEIAQRTPLLSRLGPGFTPTEDARAYYRRAALQTLRALGDLHAADPARRSTAQAALTLLQHRDNNLAQCAELIAAMLESRDQWGRYFSLQTELDEHTLDNEVRPKLERDLALVTEDHLRATHQAITDSGIDIERLIELACFAASSADGDIRNCADLAGLPGPAVENLHQWHGLIELLLTKDGDFRRGLNIKQGFPRGRADAFRKNALLEIAATLEEQQVHRHLDQIRKLPPIKFSDEEWQVAKALFRLLHSAVVHLATIFAESGTVDFTELGLAALAALRADISTQQTAPSDLALSLSGRYRHLLVDEFQDTSITQHEILSLLVAGWEEGDGRSAFIVGDPMQSIYLFRQAEMRLFTLVAKHGLADMSLENLTLQVNFRSHPALIAHHNRTFSEIFRDEDQFAFVPSQSFGGLDNQPAVDWHFFRKPVTGASVEEKDRPRREEAIRVRELVQNALQTPEDKIAILVRAKWHAGLIMEELRDANIPYRAIDMEFLSERQEVLDVLALTRALLHPADRTAWLTVFRAPWCGLGLASLEALCDATTREDRARPCLLELLPQNFAKLLPEERKRAESVYAILREGWERRDQLRLPQLVWRTWTQLGGPDCVNAEQYDNVAAFFALLEKMDAEGQPWNLQALAYSLGNLFAQPNPAATARVELLTIHKAKGLGFDVVIVPHLDRGGGDDKSQAIDWLEEPRAASQQENMAVYLAPIEPVGEEKSPLNTWVRKKKKSYIQAELKRLFYVAATRARRRLHLLGSVEVRQTNVPALKKPKVGSLLRIAWNTIDPEMIWQQVAPPGVADRIAATASVVAIRPASSSKENQIRRLPANRYDAPLPENWLAAEIASGATVPVEADFLATDAAIQASAETRARGTVLHSLVEQAAIRLAAGESLDQLDHWAAGVEPLTRRLLAARGIADAKAKVIATQVQKLLRRAIASPAGRWVLAPRPGALTEFPITHWETGTAYSLRLDRVFAAGEELGQPGDSHIWIVDYKSALHSGSSDEEFLDRQTAIYAPAMARYARAWKSLGGDQRPVRCALYFPAQDKLRLVPVESPAR